VTTLRTDDRVPRAGRPGVATLAMVAVGGAGGALARHAVGHLGAGRGPGFPVGTFVVNVTGAFGLGLLLTVLTRLPRRRLVRPLLAAGFLGAYTTFSTFAVELVTRLEDGHVPMAVAYAALTLVVGLAAAVGGQRLGGWIGRSGTPAAGAP
jgi:CrcB protein